MNERRPRIIFTSVEDRQARRRRRAGERGLPLGLAIALIVTVLVVTAIVVMAILDGAGS